MKRQELLARIQQASRLAGKDWRLERQGGRHEIWRCGSTSVFIPRHREIQEGTGEAILKDLEVELGQKWWK